MVTLFQNLSQKARSFHSINVPSEWGLPDVIETDLGNIDIADDV